MKSYLKKSNPFAHMRVGIDSYKHLVQKKDLCGPTCLQMVLFRRGVWVDQEDLAHMLETKILFDVKDIYLKPFEAVDMKNPELGLDPKNFQAPMILSLLEEHKLSPELHYPDESDELCDIIYSSLGQDNDVIVNIKLTCFFPHRMTGHFLLVHEYDKENRLITLLDPDFQNKKQWSCTLDELMDAMSNKWDGKQRGLIVIKKN